ncbi:MAG: MFS transporter [Leifsonia sp.]
MTERSQGGSAADATTGTNAEPLNASLPVGQAEAGLVMSAGQPSGADVRSDRPRVSKGYIALLTFAVFGAYIALVTPIAISLALKVEQLAPGHDEYLGYITGIGAVAPLVAAPIIGILSDRTRSRLGRRRPYIIAGLIGGMLSLAILAYAPNIIVLGAAWVLAQLSWGAAVLSGLTNSQADKLPEEQRGRVSGLVGLVQNLGPVVGAGIASSLIGQNLLVFMVPGVIALVFIVLFLIFVKDDPNPALVNADRLTIGGFFRNLVFKPAEHVDFAWNSLGRVIFNLGLAFSTTFTTFFFASRLGVKVSEIGGTIVVLALGGVVLGSLGALGGGWLSDKLRRRRSLVMAAAIVFTGGVLIMAFGSGLPVLLAGSLLTTLGVGMFASVDQAIVFDILPERDTNAGRFLGINNYATLLPQAVGPVIASGLLVIGATGVDKNYTLLFLVAAGCTLVGGLIILTRVRGTR